MRLGDRVIEWLSARWPHPVVTAPSPADEEAEQHDREQIEARLALLEAQARLQAREPWRRPRKGAS